MIVLAVLLSPLLALLGAATRAVILFWPFMIVVGALHSQIPGIPPISWVSSFLIIAAFSLLIPTSTDSD
jgi:hypothetical protein